MNVSVSYIAASMVTGIHTCIQNDYHKLVAHAPRVNQVIMHLSQVIRILNYEFRFLMKLTECWIWVLSHKLRRYFWIFVQTDRL